MERNKAIILYSLKHVTEYKKCSVVLIIAYSYSYTYKACMYKATVIQVIVICKHVYTVHGEGIQKSKERTTELSYPSYLNSQPSSPRKLSQLTQRFLCESTETTATEFK